MPPTCDVFRKILDRIHNQWQEQSQLETFYPYRCFETFSGKLPCMKSFRQQNPGYPPLYKRVTIHCIIIESSIKIFYKNHAYTEGTGRYTRMSARSLTDLAITQETYSVQVQLPNQQQNVVIKTTATTILGPCLNGYWMTIKNILEYCAII